MNIEMALRLLLAAIMIPSLAIGISAIAGGSSRRKSILPEENPPGWENRNKIKKNRSRN